MVDMPNSILSGNFALGFESGWDNTDAVTVTRLANGRTVTVVNRSPLRVMRFNGANQTVDQVKILERFKREMGGTAKSFLFQDPVHYELVGEELISSALGGETTVDLVEDFEGYTWTINHVISGSLTVYVNGTPDGGASASNGVITFGSALSVSDTVTVDCQFYTPVRFSNPLSMTRSYIGYGTISNLDLEEARGE